MPLVKTGKPEGEKTKRAPEDLLKNKKQDGCGCPLKKKKKMDTSSAGNACAQQPSSPPLEHQLQRVLLKVGWVNSTTGNAPPQRRIVLAGLSMGGAVSLYWAEQHLPSVAR